MPFKTTTIPTTAFHKDATRPAVCGKNLQNGGSRALPLLAVLAWVQIATRSALFEDDMKRIWIYIGQAKDEKSQAKDEKARQPRGFLRDKLHVVNRL